MAEYDYSDLIAQIEATRAARFPSGWQKEKLDRIFSAVSGYMRALAESGHANNYQEFAMGSMVGCSCELDTRVIIVAHCFLPPDRSDFGIIRVGRGKDKRTIDTSRMVEGPYPECPPHENWRGHFRRLIEFITTEASEPIPD
jgi:hypothetical protein